MKKWTNALILLLVVCGLNISCSDGSEIIVATPTTAIENSPTATLPLATATLITVNPAGPKYDSSCWQIKPLQDAKDIKGSFVYSNTNLLAMQNGQATVSILALGVDSMQTKRIDNFGPAELSSPDFTKIAAQINSKIFVITPDDVQTYSAPGFYLDTYLEDGRIRLYHIGDNDKGYEEGNGLALEYYILDSATGTVQKNTAFLPNYYEKEPGDRTLSYSPDMKYVLYRSSAYKNEVEFTLFDLEKNKVVWVGPPKDRNLVYLVDSHLEWRPEANWAYIAPGWVSNTDMLMVPFLDKATGQIKYYSISTDGNIAVIADFDMTDIVDGTWLQAGGARIVNHPTWSPNGRYLFTMGKAKGKDIGNFTYIWDSQENIVYKPCLPNETETVAPPRIVQYSDGSVFIVQLTFNSFIVPENRPFQGQVFKSYFIDPVKKVIYEMPDLNQVGNPLNTNSDEIKILFGWVNWEIP